MVAWIRGDRKQFRGIYDLNAGHGGDARYQFLFKVGTNQDPQIVSH
jgi:hypothetical protein